MIPNFCYIQVIVFDLSYLPVAAIDTWSGIDSDGSQIYPNLSKSATMKKLKLHNLNVTEVRYPTFPMFSPGIFNFTVGILRRIHLVSLWVHSGCHF